MTTSMTTPPRDLADAALARAVRAVLRLNGVPPDDVEDLLQDTRVEAKKVEARLPMSEPDRTNYVCGIARHLARQWRSSNDSRTQREGVVPWALRPKTPEYEERDLAMKLHDFAVAKDPVATDWLLRAKVYGEDEVAIADDEGVPPERVRKRVSRMILFLREHALTLVAAFVLIAAGAWQFVHRPREIPAPPEVRDVPPAPQPTDIAPAPPDEAMSLRQRAREECDDQEWFVCLRDLDAARALDPAGEPQEWQNLRDLANEGLHPRKPEKDKPPR
jgi:DNA-directed RNA polymerase specialized sigma24 family protein